MAKKPEPPKPTTWTICLNVVDTIRISLDDYEVIAKPVRLGKIEAADEREAIEEGAVEFKVPATRLMAIRP